MNGNMQLIDFNSPAFTGFDEGEEILLDTGILLAYLNEYDAWHTTVKKLFDNHIFGNDKVIFLFVNPTMINEVLHLGKEPLKKYIEKHPSTCIDTDESKRVQKHINNTITTLVQHDVLNVLDSDKDTLVKQIEISDDLGAGDAVHASIANEYGINFLTIDRRLSEKINNMEDKLGNIPKIYLTYAKHRDY